MNVAIIGGSAPSTVSLFQYLSSLPLVPALKFDLIGRNNKNLQAVVNAGKLLNIHSAVEIHSHEINTPDYRDAIQAADLVVIQARIGGLRGREFDEKIPLKYGICGDQDLGPGSTSAGWRVWPEIYRILRFISEVNNKALIVILSSPVSLLVRAGVYSFPRLNIAGICELPWTTALNLAQQYFNNQENFDFEYCGINHFGWIYYFTYNGHNVLPKILRSKTAALPISDLDLLKKYRGMPTPYVELHTHHNAVLDAQCKRNFTRALVVEKWRNRALAVFNTQSVENIISVLKERKSPWYEYALGPLIVGLATGKEIAPVFLSVPNKGFSSCFETSDILEIKHGIQEGKLTPVPNNIEPPGEIISAIQQMVRFEREAARAIVDRNTSILTSSLKSHPWVGGDDSISESLAEHIASYTLDETSMGPALFI